MIFNMASGGGGTTLEVIAPAGVTVTISKNGNVKTAVADTNGKAKFSGLKGGTWVLSITDGTATETAFVEIPAEKSIRFTDGKLYWIGNEYLEKTGGWYAYDRRTVYNSTPSNKLFEKRADKIASYASSPGGNYYGTSILTTRIPVYLGDVNAVNVNFKLGIKRGGIYATCYIVDPQTRAIIASKKVQSSSVNDDNLLSVDTSELEGQYLIEFSAEHVYSGGNSPNFWLYIDKIYCT